MFAFNGGNFCLVSEKSLADNSTTSIAEAAPTTQQHREAAAALIDHSNEDILAWLKLVRSARSIEPNLEQCPGSAHLSPSQIHALFALKDCPHDILLGCLELTRLCRNVPTTIAFGLGSAIDSRLSNIPAPFLEKSDPSVFETKLWMEPTKQYSSQPGYNSRSRHLAADGLFGQHPVGLVNSTLSRHTENHYWCTVCETPNSYKYSGNWKKHEKGHETVYVCGFDDSVEDSWAGQCSSTKPFSCKRRDIMVNHLNKSHGIFAVQQGRDLANTYRVSVTKQAWSCGFCVKLFLAFHERLKHIDIEHFRKYENIQDWDLNKVIHGLMLQPKMENAWKRRTASIFPSVRPEDLVWADAFAKDMRTKLEIGPLNEVDANRLVDVVCSASKPRECLHDIIMAPTTVNNIASAGASPLSSSKQGQVMAVPVSKYCTDHHQSSSNTRTTTYHTEDSLIHRLLGYAYNYTNTAAPLTTFPDEGNQEDYIAPPFSPSQEWSAALESRFGYADYG